MADKNCYEIVYDSDFIIDDPVELSTLCVFYDKVYLPYYDHDISVSEEYTLRSKISDWDKQTQLLFDNGVLERCHRSDSLLSHSLKSDEFTFAEVKELYDKFRTSKNSGDPLMSIDFGLVAFYTYHIFRFDLSVPRLSTQSRNVVHRETLKTQLADQAFRYCVPALAQLHPEQVLEVRAEIAELREGFSMHLQSLTSYIDAQLQDGESDEEIGRYAENVIETKLQPQYVEFNRQLGSIDAGMGRSIVTAGGSFYVAGSLFKQAQYVEALIAFLCGGALVIPEMLKDSLSNERQAYQFMRIVEDTIDM